MSKRPIQYITVAAWITAIIGACAIAPAFESTVCPPASSGCTSVAPNRGSIVFGGVFIGIYVTLSLVGIVLGVIKTAQTGHWGWTLAIIFTALLGLTAYSIVGPEYRDDSASLGTKEPGPSAFPRHHDLSTPPQGGQVQPPDTGAIPSSSLPPYFSSPNVRSSTPVQGPIPPSQPLAPAPGHATLPPYYPYYPPPTLDARASLQINAGSTSRWALFSLICGLIALFTGIFAIPAVIFGHLGLAEIKKDPKLQGRGMAIAGLVIGYIIIGLLALGTIVVIALVGLFAASHPQHGLIPDLSSWGVFALPARCKI